MNKVSKHIIVFLVIFLFNSEINGQSEISDSLLKVLKNAKDDTNKVNALNSLSWEYDYFNPDTTIIILNQALHTAKKIKWLKGEADALGNIGVYYFNKANYVNSLDYFLRALKIDEKLKNNKGIASSLGNIGNIYYNQANFEKAIEHYFKALKLDEKSKNKSGISLWYGNIGLAYMELLDYNKGLKYFFSALKINKELDNQFAIANNYCNIGIVYGKQKANKKALEYLFDAKKLNEKIGDKRGLAIVLGNIGSLYLKEGNFKKAEIFLKQSTVFCDSLGALMYIRDFEKAISELYDTTNRPKLALEHYKKYIAARDSISNEENTKLQVQKEMQYTFDKQQTADSIKTTERTKQEKLKHDQEIKQQRIYTFGGIIGFSLMLIVAIVSIRAFRNKQKANIIIAQQKQLVEEKQKEVLDSIHYAKRIQLALLPSEKNIDKQLRKLN